MSPFSIWLRENKQWRPMVRAYLAVTTFVDAQVGRVLEAVDEAGVADNTVVVLWSDHGWHLGEKGISGKCSLWSESTRVPLVFAGPGIAADASCDAPVELLDVYPTLVDLCGLPRKVELEGASLRPQLQDASAPRSRPAITTMSRNNHAVRTADWCYLRYADGSEELYDRKQDPAEWKNLADDPRFAEIKSDLARLLPVVNTPPVRGSSKRLVERKGGRWLWQGQEIVPKEAIK